VAAEGAADKEGQALDVLTRIRTLDVEHAARFAALLAERYAVWSIAEAAFAEQCELRGVDLAGGLYEESFEVATAVDNIMATASSSAVPRRVIAVLTTCSLAILHPECAASAGEKASWVLVSEPLAMLDRAAVG
jgi:hypothetical protein